MGTLHWDITVHSINLAQTLHAAAPQCTAHCTHTTRRKEGGANFVRVYIASFRRRRRLLIAHIALSLPQFFWKIAKECRDSQLLILLSLATFPLFGGLSTLSISLSLVIFVRLRQKVRPACFRPTDRPTVTDLPIAIRSADGGEKRFAAAAQKSSAAPV